MSKANDRLEAILKERNDIKSKIDNINKVLWPLEDRDRLLAREMASIIDPSMAKASDLDCEMSNRQLRASNGYFKT